MTDEQLDVLWKEAKTKVTVGCDEAHAHSALRGCIRGDDQAVVICKLVEVIRRERGALREAMKIVGAEYR